MLSLIQRLGRLRHQTHSVYRLRNEIDDLRFQMMQKQKHIEQIKTVVAIQTNDVRETLDKSKTQSGYIPPVNMVYVCSEIARREDELAEVMLLQRETAKNYAYKLYCLQTLHNSIIDLAQSTQEDARMFAIPFDFRACFQAVQDTSFDAEPAKEPTDGI